MNRVIRTAAFLWRHLAAAIALLLIAVAFVAGYRAGRPEAAPADASTPSADVDRAPATLYTCSMHPTVRLTDPKAKCPICHMDLIPVAAADDTPGSASRLVLTRAAAEAARAPKSMRSWRHVKIQHLPRRQAT